MKQASTGKGGQKIPHLLLNTRGFITVFKTAGESGVTDRAIHHGVLKQRVRQGARLTCTDFAHALLSITALKITFLRFTNSMYTLHVQQLSKKL